MFRLTVLDPSTSLSCVQSVQATVIRSDLVAIISGAYERSAVLGSMITLDASYSYDADLPSELDELDSSSLPFPPLLIRHSSASSSLPFIAIESHFYLHIQSFNLALLSLLLLRLDRSGCRSVFQLVLHSDLSRDIKHLWRTDACTDEQSHSRSVSGAFICWIEVHSHGTYVSLSPSASLLPLFLFSPTTRTHTHIHTYILLTYIHTHAYTCPAPPHHIDTHLISIVLDMSHSNR